MITNPYDYTRPVDQFSMFFGRTGLLDFLLNHLVCPKMDSFVIYGGRRMGKTSMMRMLEKRLKENYRVEGGGITIPIYLDMQLLMPQSPLDFFMLIRTALGLWWLNNMNETIVLPEIRNQDPAKSFADLFSELYHSQHKNTNNINLAILIDESDKLQRPPWAHELDDYLRSLLSNVPGVTGHIGVVMTGGIGLYEDMMAEKYMSPLRNVLKEEIPLASINAEDMMSLLQTPSFGQLTPVIADAVLALVGGHLFLGQYFMHHLWESGLDTVNVDHVHDIAESFKRRRDFQGWHQSIGKIGRQIYGYLIQNPSGGTYQAIAKNLGIGILLCSKELTKLCFHGLIKKDIRHYRLHGDLFKEWFIEYGCLDEIVETDEMSKSEYNSKYVINIHNSDRFEIGDYKSDTATNDH